MSKQLLIKWIILSFWIDLTVVLGHKELLCSGLPPTSKTEHFPWGLMISLLPQYSSPVVHFQVPSWVQCCFLCICCALGVSFISTTFPRIFTLATHYLQWKPGENGSGQILLTCHMDIKCGMFKNFLQLNNDKMELIMSHYPDSTRTIAEILWTL